jgi:WD40 repeat protein
MIRFDWNYLRRRMALPIIGLALFLFSGIGLAADRPGGTETPRADRLGDPLPRGAIARLGSARFQHGLGIHRVAYSPDGKVLATSSYKVIRLWDAATGREICHLNPFGYQYPPAFSPDGKFIAAVDLVQAANRASWSVGVWDAATGLKLRRTQSFDSQLNNLVYSPDGESFAANIWHTPTAATTLIFDADTMELRHQIKPIRGAPVSALGYTRGGKALIVMENDSGPRGEEDLSRQTGTIYLYDVKTAKRTKIIRAASLFSGFDPAISRDGDMLAAILADGSISVIDLKSGHELQHFDNGYGTARIRLAFSPDGKTLATGSRPAFLTGLNKDPLRSPTMVIQLWDLTAGQKSRSLFYETRQDDTGITGLSFSPDGKTLASSSDELFVRLWDLAKGEQTFPGPDDPYLTGPTVFSPDGKSLIVGSPNGYLASWDILTGAKRWQVHAYLNRIQSLIRSPDGATVFTWADNLVKTWETATGKPIRETLVDAAPGASTLDVGSDGRTLLAGSPSLLRLYDLEKGRREVQLPDHLEEKQVVTDDRPKEEEQRFVFNAAGAPARVQAFVVQRPQPVPLTVAAARFLPGKTTILADFVNCLLEYDPAQGREVRRIELSRPLSLERTSYPLVISADGRRLAVWDEDVRLIDLADGREVARFAVPGPALVGGAAFSPDGKYLAGFSAGRIPNNQPDFAEGSTIWLWDIASGRLVARIDDPHRGKVSELLFSPDGALLVSTSGADSTLLVWDVATLAAAGL